MAKILANVRHVVVVMFENRSFDTMLGYLYRDGPPPALFLPSHGAREFDGVRPGMENPTTSGTPIFATAPAASTTVPNPDPQETFANVTAQILGTKPGEEPMKGFVANYQTTDTTDPGQIMQCRSPEQLPVLSALARAYAVSDAWFASVPSQTWPNRAFAHAGTSNGHVDNGAIPDPFDWNVRTIFEVLSSVGATWAVYGDAPVVPSLTRTMFPSLWSGAYEQNFQGFQAFVDACANDTLPQYAFIEPSFLLDPNDQHPPHDVSAGDAFLYDIWRAVSTSPAWDDTLLIVTYDEHGGCFDHVLPPANAVPPDATSTPGDANFGFDRFGVRVPTVVVSPYIAAGTVFRSPTATPYDHTSLLATLRDWIGIAPDAMLTSARIAAAPTLDPLLTLSAPRADLPDVPAPSAAVSPTPLTLPLNDLQKSLVTGTARRAGRDPAAALAPLATRKDALDFFGRVN